MEKTKVVIRKVPTNLLTSLSVGDMCYVEQFVVSENKLHAVLMYKNTFEMFPADYLSIIDESYNPIVIVLNKQSFDLNVSCKFLLSEYKGSELILESRIAGIKILFENDLPITLTENIPYETTGMGIFYKHDHWKVRHKLLLELIEKAKDND